MALYQCGLGRLKLGDVRGAYEDFKEAARLEPRDFEIWQKYEETYRAAESEVEKDLSNVTWTHSRSSGDGERQMLSGRRAPHHFSLRRPSEVKLDQEVIQAQTRGSVTGEESPAGDMQARVFRPATRLLGGANRGGTDQAGTAPQQNNPDPSSASGRDEDGRGFRGAQQTTFEVKLVQSQNYMVIHFSWSITWLTALYYYRVRLVRSGRFSSGAFAEMSFGFAVVALVTVVVWRLRKRNASLSISLTDAIKVLALVVISICALIHLIYEATF